MSYIFYLVGRSCSGKDTLRSMILNDPELKLNPIIQCTTRPKRTGEVEGREYYFRTDRNFFDSLMDGKLIEYKRYKVSNEEDWIYYTEKDAININKYNYIGIGPIGVYDNLKEKFGNSVVPIFLYVEEYLLLYRSMEREDRRKEPDRLEACRRFVTDSKEFNMKEIKKRKMRIVDNNGEIENAFKDIKEYILDFLKNKSK